MPELPEMEITARLIGDAVKGEVAESVTAPGLNTIKTHRPPVQVLEGEPVTGLRRRGKVFRPVLGRPDPLDSEALAVQARCRPDR